ncbi:calcium/sodium antiporter [Candidatus Woesearchaeota archaeon]|nr:calcium/sodium antiporter [Candidatus Woesearchaeota archaeon]
MITHILLFLLGLFLLVKGSDFFVKSAASIAKRFGISEFVIGLTLVAFGTQIPDLASAVIASLGRDSGIVIGNVVGANIMKVGIVLGIASVIALIKTNEDMLKRDGYIMLFAAFLFYAFILDRTITRIEAGILLLFYFAYIMFLFTEQRQFKGMYGFKHFMHYFFRLGYISPIRAGLVSTLNRRKNKVAKQKQAGSSLKDFLILIISCFVVFFGAKYFVSSAVFFAEYFKVPETLIGLTLVSLGTTVPELSVSILAAKRGYGNIAVGNIIGSNITSVFLLLGVSGLINPLSIIRSTVFYSAPFMILMSILLLVFIKSDWELRRFEGVSFIGLYILFIVFLFLINLHLL